MSVGHYENFPVASWLIPSSLRPAVRAIYRFARTADDLADEGDAPPTQRLAALDELRDQLKAIAASTTSQWPDLADAIRQHRLPLQPFYDLLSAFSQDVTTTRYDSFQTLSDYCRRSANPVGYLMLKLFQRDAPDLQRQSDAVCTALQLANFWQDIAIDIKKGRVYVPQQDLVTFGVSEAQIARGEIDQNWQRLMSFQVQRARSLLIQGAPLARALGGRIGLELRMVVQGGLRILERIDTVGGDVFARRPQLTTHDWMVMSWRAMRTVTVA